MHYIYMIVNKVNGKTYVGQHKSSNWQDSYMGSGKILRLAKKKYGLENFEKFLIQYCSSREEADRAEIFWIAEYRKRGKAEYNLAKGGEGNATPCSEETRKKLSEASKGENNPLYGKHHSSETRRKISEANKGKEAWDKGLKRDLMWFTNGIENRLCKDCPDGFRKGRISPTKNTKWKLVDGKRIYFKETLDV